jgi:iron complex outermembrane recepter protein
VFDNLFDARTTGVEATARWQPAACWRLEGSYTHFHLTPTSGSSSLDPDVPGFDSDTPGHQWQLRSSLSAFDRTDLDVMLFRVGALTQHGVAAYTRADVRVEHPLSQSTTIALSGQNLLRRGHQEFAGTTAQMIATDLPRTISLTLIWRPR